MCLLRLIAWPRCGDGQMTWPDGVVYASESARQWRKVLKGEIEPRLENGWMECRTEPVVAALLHPTQ